MIRERDLEARRRAFAIESKKQAKLEGVRLARERAEKSRRPSIGLRLAKAILTKPSPTPTIKKAVRRKPVKRKVVRRKPVKRKVVRRKALPDPIF